MKRFIGYCIFVFSITLLLCSCMGTEERFKIGVSQCSLSTWHQQMDKEIMQEALFYRNVVTEFRRADDDNERQIEDIQYFIDKKVDLLIISVNESEPLKDIVEKAYDEGIPIILVDRKIYSNKYTAYIGTDNYDIGKSVAEYIASELNFKGNVVEVVGLKGSSSSLERKQGFMDAISTYPDIKVVASLPGDWKKDKAGNEFMKFLSSGTKVDAVFAHNDLMASGVYNAIQESYLEEGPLIVGVDGLPEEKLGMDMVQKKQMKATFICPTNGGLAIKTAMKILYNEEFPKDTLVKTFIIDEANANAIQFRNLEIVNLDSKIDQLNNRLRLIQYKIKSRNIIIYGSLAFVFFIVILLIWLYISYQKNKRLTLNLEKQQEILKDQRDKLVDINDKLEKATNARLAFFTNVSYELRTPLTLIVDPLKRLMEDENIAESSRRILILANRNVKSLFRLINHLLDFRKYEEGKIIFTPVLVNLKKFFEHCCEAFIEEAKNKQIGFNYDIQKGVDYHTVVDKLKMESIFFNLISNVMKFSPKEARISLRLEGVLEDDTDYIRFSINNSASHIPDSAVKDIFDRLYNVDKIVGCSGLGLALVKAYVEMHRGRVEVTSSKESGTTFIVTIPIVRGHISPENMTPNTISKKDIYIPETVHNESINRISKDEDKELLLAVDANPDILTYLAEILGDTYNIITSEDAIDGIEKAVRFVPDLIISDVMMPKMDGTEFCRRLKSLEQTSHIPIILLATSSRDEQRSIGYDAGADSYIYKPFNSKVLLSRIRNLIASRARLRESLIDISIAHKEHVSELDKSFINKFKGIIEQNIDDYDLNVEKISHQLGLSRAQLYRKLKTLTNYSPNEFVRIYRLKKASSILSSTDKTVSEIAYSVGFSNSSYFIKCFKEYFGHSPREYNKTKNNQ